MMIIRQTIKYGEQFGRYFGRSVQFTIAAKSLFKSRVNSPGTIAWSTARALLARLPRPALRTDRDFIEAQPQHPLAHVATFGERTVDVFYVTDLLGAQIVSPTRQAPIKRAQLLAGTGEGTAAKVSEVRGAGHRAGVVDATFEAFEPVHLVRLA
jgi:hypothetical protein